MSGTNKKRDYRPLDQLKEELKELKKVSDELIIDKNMFINEKKGKVTNDYVVQETIGKGGYGEVKKVVHKITGETRAMKIIAKDGCDEIYMKTLTNEISILRNLDHPHIIKLYEIYQDSHCIYMIMEYMQGGDLFSILQKRK